MTDDAADPELPHGDTTHTWNDYALLERIVSHVPAAIALLDQKLVYRWVNPEFTRLYGVEPERLLNQPIGHVFPEANVQMVPHMTRVLETGRPFTERAFPFYYTVAGAGRMTYWDISFCPLPGAGQQPEGIVALSIEVSDRVENERRAREQIDALKESDRLRSELLSLVSHELRTPIHAMMGFGRILEKGRIGPLNDLQRIYIGKMLEVADNLAGIVTDILDMSQIQAGMLSFRPQAVDLEAIAREATASLAALAEQKQLTVEFDCAPDLPPALGDALRLGQVVTNLVSNAIKFTPPGGRVVVATRRVPGSVRLQVRDTGIGIRAVDVGQLFQPFMQVDRSATRSHGGTGLGLSISRGIIEAHGGRIGVESTPGHGSSFWFTVPFAAMEPQAMREPQAQGTEGNGHGQDSVD